MKSRGQLCWFTHLCILNEVCRLVGKKRAKGPAQNEKRKRERVGRAKSWLLAINSAPPSLSPSSPPLPFFFLPKISLPFLSLSLSLSHSLSVSVSVSVSLHPPSQLFASASHLSPSQPHQDVGKLVGRGREMGAVCQISSMTWGKRRRLVGSKVFCSWSQAYVSVRLHHNVNAYLAKCFMVFNMVIYVPAAWEEAGHNENLFSCQCLSNLSDSAG